MIPHLARRLRFEQFPVRRQRRARRRLSRFPGTPIRPRLSQLPASSRGTYSARASRPNGGSRNTISKGGAARCAGSARRPFPPPGPCRRRPSGSIAPAVRAQRPQPARRTPAPWLRATRPRAPARRSPANKSRQRAPAMSCCSQLNRVSRTRSGVGRRPGMSGKLTRRPRQPPPMMRTELRPPGAFDSVLRCGHSRYHTCP